MPPGALQGSGALQGLELAIQGGGASQKKFVYRFSVYTLLLTTIKNFTTCHFQISGFATGGAAGAVNYVLGEGALQKFVFMGFQFNLYY